MSVLIRLFGLKYPGELYAPSVREYSSPEPPEYPYHDKTIQVTRCGRICIEGRKINLSTVFAGQFVGIREVSDLMNHINLLFLAAETSPRLP